MDDVVFAPRALVGSRLAAKITFHQRGYAGAKINLAVEDTGGNENARQAKILASRTVTLGPDGNLQTETLMFDIGAAGARTLRISAFPLQGEQNTANNALTRLVNVSSDPRRILYIENEPRWEYKFIRQAERLGGNAYGEVHLVKAYALIPLKLYKEARYELQASLTREHGGSVADQAKTMLAQVNSLESVPTVAQR